MLSPLGALPPYTPLCSALLLLLTIVSLPFLFLPLSLCIFGPLERAQDSATKSRRLFDLFKFFFYSNAFFLTLQTHTQPQGLSVSRKKVSFFCLCSLQLSSALPVLDCHRVAPFWMPRLFEQGSYLVQYKAIPSVKVLYCLEPFCIGCMHFKGRDPSCYDSVSVC